MIAGRGLAVNVRACASAGTLGRWTAFADPRRHPTPLRSLLDSLKPASPSRRLGWLCGGSATPVPAARDDAGRASPTTSRHLRLVVIALASHGDVEFSVARSAPQNAMTRRALASREDSDRPTGRVGPEGKSRARLAPPFRLARRTAQHHPLSVGRLKAGERLAHRTRAWRLYWVQKHAHRLRVL